MLTVEHLTYRYSRRGAPVLRGVDLTLESGEIGILLGCNGSGKTTLFKTIVGLEPLTSGELEVGETVKISYVDQNRSGIDPDKNLWEVVSDGLDHMMVGETEVPSRAYVASFGFKGQDQQKRAGVLSGGERTRLAILKLLLEPVNLLILDEPTNHLDLRTKDVLKQALQDFDGTLIVVSHDRDFLDGLVSKVYEFGHGRVREHLCGIYEFLETKKMESLQELEKK